MDSILAIKKRDEPTDFFMVEIMEMKHKSRTDTSSIRELVLGHGALFTKKRVVNTSILACSMSLGYEKMDVNSVVVF